ncbi:(2Fe-2S)-binding protein [Nocardiopsis sp. FR6]|uniref:(2Fe-2S)-binding protein n=1 Tax=Nocardiopsis sp. FR6 TaxID=2605986 RepID=UPI00351A436C
MVLALLAGKGQAVRERALGPVLADVGRINALFALEAGPAGTGWLPLEGIDGDTDALAAEVERVRAHLARASRSRPGRVEWRVAASVFQQGLATRVLSPVVAAALCHGVLVDAARFHWDPHREGPMVLRTAQRRARPAPRGGEAVADWVEHTVVTGVLARLARGLAAVGGVAPGLLRGNTAAALAGTVRALSADRPDSAGSAHALAHDLLERPSLAGTGGYAGTDDEGLAVFRRTTCCLYYRAPGGGYCGDCALGG